MESDTKKILIAEDDSPIALVLEHKLRKGGFDVIHAVDGELCIHHLSESEFDLLLLVIMMPKVNGFGVLEHMQQNDIEVPVVVFSQLNQEEDITRAKELGAQDYFVKSETSLADVVEHIQETLTQSVSPV